MYKRPSEGAGRFSSLSLPGSHLRLQHEEDTALVRSSCSSWKATLRNVLFMTNSSKIAQDLPGQQVLVLLERENLDHALELEDPTVAKQDAERDVHETGLDPIVILRREPGKSENEFPERLDVLVLSRASGRGRQAQQGGPQDLKQKHHQLGVLGRPKHKGRLWFQSDRHQA